MKCYQKKLHLFTTFAILGNWNYRNGFDCGIASYAEGYISYSYSKNHSTNEDTLQSETTISSKRNLMSDYSTITKLESIDTVSLLNTDADLSQQTDFTSDCKLMKNSFKSSISD